MVGARVRMIVRMRAMTIVRVRVTVRMGVDDIAMATARLRLKVSGSV